MESQLGFGHLKDQEFISAFEECAFDPAAFHHADHVRLARLYLKELGPSAAEERMLCGIRKLAAHAGVPEKFLFTTTVAWVRLVALAREKDPAEDSFDTWISRHPQLLDRNLLDRYYSKSLLKTMGARSGWVEPDLAPLA